LTGPCVPQFKPQNVFLLEVALKHKTFNFAIESSKDKKNLHETGYFSFVQDVNTVPSGKHRSHKVYSADTKIPLQYMFVLLERKKSSCYYT